MSNLPVGIDRIGLYTPQSYLDPLELAQARQQPQEKYTQGLGIEKIALVSPEDTILSMAQKACTYALDDLDPREIELVLFATETSIDQSKAAGLFLQKQLQLSSQCRFLEIKQACYGSTGALQLGLAMVAQKKAKKVLVIGADIAHYEIGSPAEPTQGAGACALILSTHPQCLEIEPESGLFSEDVMDFWRPNDHTTPIVQGKLSLEMYLKGFFHAYHLYEENSLRTLLDHHAFCFHVPFPRLAQKAHQKLLHASKVCAKYQKHLTAQLELALKWPQQIGNSYTASLYMSICSYLFHAKENLVNQRLGLYSYGSGCMAEVFSARVMQGYQKAFNGMEFSQHLAKRTQVSIQEYESLYANLKPATTPT